SARVRVPPSARTCRPPALLLVLLEDGLPRPARRLLLAAPSSRLSNRGARDKDIPLATTARAGATLRVRERRIPRAPSSPPRRGAACPTRYCLGGLRRRHAAGHALDSSGRRYFLWLDLPGSLD